MSLQKCKLTASDVLDSPHRLRALRWQVQLDGQGAGEAVCSVGATRDSALSYP
jgi:hypothetical protein